jgi:hypothetical protein
MATTYMRSKIMEFVKKAAKRDELTVSSYLERLVEKEMERSLHSSAAMDGDCDDGAVITREEILRRCEEADDPKNCIAHESIESMIKSLHERAS